MSKRWDISEQGNESKERGGAEIWCEYVGESGGECGCE